MEQACYKCGSPEGNEARLCPKCTKARIMERVAVNQEDSHISHEVLRESPEIEAVNPLDRPLVKCGMVGFFVAGMSWFALFSVYGPGWGVERSQFIYNKCISKLGSDKGFRNFAAKQPRGGELEQAFVDFGNALISEMPKMICETVKQKCSGESSDPICQAF